MRERAGIIDRSDVGKLVISGKDRFTWLQGMISNDTKLLESLEAPLQACVLDATGHLLADVKLMNISGENPLKHCVFLPDDDFILMELPRVCLEKIKSVFDRFLIMEDVEILDVTDKLACLSFQGPSSSEVELSQRQFDFPACSWYPIAANHTGIGGIDLYFASEQLYERRLHLAVDGYIEISEPVQELLRVEAGIPKYGIDMDENMIALEANLGPTHISFTKGCYVGQEIIARIDSRGHTNRALTGFVILEGELPIAGARLNTISAEDGTDTKEAGWLTTVVAESPAMQGKPIALGYARHEFREPGMRLHSGEEANSTVLEVVELPFYRKSEE